MTPHSKKKMVSSKAMKKRKPPKAGLSGLDDAVGAKHHLVHVNVNVVNSADGDGHKKNGTIADNALRKLRGY